MNRYKDWLEQGKRDLNKAEIDLEFQYYEWACFSSQQAAEKIVKALGLKLGIEIWGHSISHMLRVIEENLKIKIPREIKELATLLDKYYIPPRYPNGFPLGKPADYYTEKEAKEAIDAVHKILQWCEGYMAG